MIMVPKPLYTPNALSPNMGKIAIVVALLGLLLLVSVASAEDGSSSDAQGQLGVGVEQKDDYDPSVETTQVGNDITNQTEEESLSPLTVALMLIGAFVVWFPLRRIETKIDRV